MFDISKPTIGLNLSKANDWRTDAPFADLRHAFREPGVPGAPEQPYTGPRDARRWPTQPFESLIDGWAYPDGKYEVEAKGCEVEFTGMNMRADLTDWESYAQEWEFKGQGGQLRCLVTPQAENYTYSIRVPGESRDNGIWRLDYLADIRRASVFRTLDMIPANNSPVTNPADLVPPDPITRTWIDWGPNALCGGPPWADVVDLAQRTGATPWCVLPPMATVETWRAILTELAKLGRPVILEASNEPWNWAFGVQDAWQRAQGKAAGITDVNDWGVGVLHSALREAQLATLAKEVMGDNAWVVHSAHFYNPWLTAHCLGFLKDRGYDPSTLFKAVAVAPYVGDKWVCADGAYDENEIGRLGKLARGVFGFGPDMSVDDVMRGLGSALAAVVIPTMNDAVAAGNEWNLPTIAYEFGQHLEGRDVYKKAQRDERMGLIYLKMLTAWKTSKAGLACLYSHCDGKDLWGLKTSLGDNGSPKWQAFTSVAATRNDANDPGPIVTPTPTPEPTPTPTVPPRQPHTPEGREAVFRWVEVGGGEPEINQPILLRFRPDVWERGFWDGIEFKPDDDDDIFIARPTHWSYVPEPTGGGR